ncbi:MAG: Gfo/Idh/MocA family oxidoreductase [Verrucomicrobiota bacterium]
MADRKPLSRRNFLKSSAAATAGLAWTAKSRAQVSGANERVRLGLIGCGSRGGKLARNFGELGEVDLVALSDADRERMETLPLPEGALPQVHQDYRRLLDDPTIDAVVIATPNHWHALMGIQGLDAGKHVHVEKPLSHSIWEGRQLVNFAAQSQLVAMTGTQHRSDPGIRAAAESIQRGDLGAVQFIHSMHFSVRNPIQAASAPREAPATCDEELWAGPAPLVGTTHRERFHYDWHWFWNWGNGEMGNWGPHRSDDIRHLLGWEAPAVPDNVISLGGRYLWQDGGETANMQLAYFDYQGLPVVFEVRNLPRAAGQNAPGSMRGTRSANFVQCEGGSYVIGRSGGRSFDLEGQPVGEFKGNGGQPHFGNFIAAIKGEASALTASMEAGHHGANLCHVSNISYRLGMEMDREEAESHFQANQALVESLQSFLGQIEANGVDLASEGIRVGPSLRFDPQKEMFVGPLAERANQLVKGSYRPGFVVPETGA